ncbi:hypothetical protein BJ986_002175 [Phycicoccus badiiscoriae]|uniref:Uncharacterized protein n=1 Tax=Pedococcus badiiscoriae TaxID=642776 RepID=A0A852WFC1_9MICO|nr:hypothetical protein [Pedococcus badiiscoriae]NYG07688.1 hypothetical protein [Pedococcus badiiscoriae]
MTEPSSGVPGEIADADVDAPTTDEPTTVKLDLDEEKLEAWDEIKGDYQIEPGGEPVPNSMDADAVGSDDPAAGESPQS